jgi:hypothetical protein
MKTITVADLDLMNMFRDEMNTLKEYEEALGSMSVGKKEEPRE